jgi:xanthine dehydrogenase accessory factor
MEERGMSDNQLDIGDAATAWRDAGEMVAIATVTETWAARRGRRQPARRHHLGRSPARSGGCIEGAVAEAAMKTIASGVPQLLDFGITD